MYKTVAFQSNLGASTTSLANLAAVSDQNFPVSGNYIYMTDPVNQIIGAAGVGNSMDLAQLTSPTLRSVYPYDLSKVDPNAAPSHGENFELHQDNPLALQPDEGLEALATNTDSSPHDESIIVFLSDGPISPADIGGFRTVRFTSSQPSTAGVWSAQSLSLQETLPPGTYQVVGMKIEDDEVIAGRLVPIGGNERPGVIASNGRDSQGKEIFRKGKMGVMTEFNSREIPGLELFSSGSSGGDLEGYLDLVKTG